MNTASFPNRNIWLLCLSQAILLTHSITLVTIDGLVGAQLAPHAKWSTLPITAFVFGSALIILPAAFFMQRFGRRLGFSLAALFGMAGCACSAFAIWQQNFWLLCLGAIFIGNYMGIGQYYRFAASEVVDANFKSKAISWVLAGGIVGGVVGPELSKFTRDLMPTAFVGSFIIMMLLSAAAFFLARQLNIPHSRNHNASAPQARALFTIIRQPIFIIAVLGAALGSGVMSLLMTATPLAMHAHHHSYNATAFVIEWHVIAMFLPSFFTGHLIQKHGAQKVMLAGIAFNILALGFAFSHLQVLDFWLSLVCVGIGWNFLFIGGTTLLTHVCLPGEQAKVQGSNDFLVLCAQLIASLSAGFLLAKGGWLALNIIALPFVLLVLVAVLFLREPRTT
ncbi:MAG: MFS transporter [Gammaproteobacteria bacterium]|nr:MFS transporter [Gammaproteobacteria bacterium]